MEKTILLKYLKFEDLKHYVDGPKLRWIIKIITKRDE